MGTLSVQLRVSSCEEIRSMAAHPDDDSELVPIRTAGSRMDVACGPSPTHPDLSWLTSRRIYGYAAEVGENTVFQP